MAQTCNVCGKRAYSEFCVAHRPRKPIQTHTLPPKPKHRIKQQSKREQEYQVWKEQVARPYLMEVCDNRCSCCLRKAYDGEKLDIEHTITKGSRPDLKRDLNNLTLMCRICHIHKTRMEACDHRAYLSNV